MTLDEMLKHIRDEHHDGQDEYDREDEYDYPGEYEPGYQNDLNNWDN